MNINKKAWEQDAEKVVRWLALMSAINNEPFTSNDVWALDVLPVPPNRRWLGPIMRRVASDGSMVKVAEGVLSEFGHGATNNGLWLGRA